ncbi:hypothetical protein N781_08110 [Pontibacillus halophilus JSM 076056 = DSM 19796]|uniref:UVR domain-containing protein n=1 Tax=Pontibacillus halophilus JSM 076056 = DSM 19796 TaxID=1385510 RepID=A0A0A5GGT0_9BACI|nr:UvrB/UvrC motif-containing protein [Pontibacillus halophilus]KGX90418.1 hypothetical protein N781_08110 [Pontibacillus halophilus JSM 076056 = DSM 19796]
MECQECHERPATLHFTQVINGNKKEIHVCEVCAKEKGYMSNDDDEFSLHHLLSGLFNFDTYSINGQDHYPSNPSQQRVLQCPNCGLTYPEFKRIGKFGCSQCYETFSEHLNPIFRRVHSGNTSHDGKIPSRKGGSLQLKKQIADQKRELNQLIEDQEFEQAATMRDSIRDLEQQLSDHRKGGDS